LLHHLWLFYSNRRPEDAAFPEELEKENPYYKFIGTMTEMARSPIKLPRKPRKPRQVAGGGQTEYVGAFAKNARRNTTSEGVER
jgi:hypothetical protein